MMDTEEIGQHSSADTTHVHSKAPAGCKVKMVIWRDPTGFLLQEPGGLLAPCWEDEVGLGCAGSRRYLWPESVRCEAD